MEQKTGFVFTIDTAFKDFNKAFKPNENYKSLPDLTQKAYFEYCLHKAKSKLIFVINDNL